MNSADRKSNAIAKSTASAGKSNWTTQSGQARRPPAGGWSMNAALPKSNGIPQSTVRAGESNFRKLSTDAAAATGKSNGGAIVNRSPEFLELDRRRAAIGVTVGGLLHGAGVSLRSWERIRAGAVTPQRRTLVKLSRALDALAGAGKPMPQPSMVAAFWRAAVLYLSAELGADPALALGDAGPSSPYSPAWLAASRARQLAFYLAHVELSLTHSALAAALGTSKQRVHKAIGRVEDLRDDPAIDALLERAGAFLSGRPAPASASTPTVETCCDAS